MTFRKLKEMSRNVRKCFEFSEVSKFSFSGQSEKPHFLLSGFNSTVQDSLSVIVRSI